MNSGIFKTDWATVGDSILTAIVVAVLVALYGVVTTTGFDVFTADWTGIGHQMVNLGVVSGVTVLGKDFLSTNSGSLLGVGPSGSPSQG